MHLRTHNFEPTTKIRLATTCSTIDFSDKILSSGHCTFCHSSLLALSLIEGSRIYKKSEFWIRPSTSSGLTRITVRTRRRIHHGPFDILRVHGELVETWTKL